MRKVSIENASGDQLDIHRRKLSEPLETTDLVLNYYRLAPGEGLPGGLHAHMDQEEVFVVLDGEAIFETMDGGVTVEDGEAIRFAPGEFQSGKNEAESELVLLALGAPRDSDDVRFPLSCPDCGHEKLRFGTDKGEPLLVCPDCDAEHIPQQCPDCGHDDLRATLDAANQTIVVCHGCDAEFDMPPLR